MSKVHCDCCNIDLLKGGFAHHKKTKKHLVEEAKKFGKFDFSTGQIIQSGGIVEKPIVKQNDVFKDISIDLDDIPSMDKIVYDTNMIYIKRLDANLSKKDIYVGTLALLKDFMRDIQHKPSLIGQLESVIQKM